MVEHEKEPYVQIHYEKNPLYRTVFADGAVGGETPSGAFNLTFYATRKVIPKSTRHAISVDGKVNPIGIPSGDSKKGIMREVEVGVYMNMKTAKEIFDFLKPIFDTDGK